MTLNYQGIFFFDISTHQDSPLIYGTVDFQKMKSYGASCVILRASNGLAQDADYITFRANARGVLPMGAYHYYNNLKPPQDQAQKFYDVIKDEMPPVVVLDLEDKQSGFIGWHHWYDWLAKFKALSGMLSERIWIYTNETYFGECSGPITEVQRNWFKQFPLWLASPYYGDPLNPDYALVDIPAPWTEAELIALQTGTPAIGYSVGVESRDIDYDQFNGDRAKFEQMFGIAPTEPPTEETPMQQATIKNTTSLRVRSGPGTNYVQVSGLYPGDIAYGVSDPSGWFHISSIKRADGTTATLHGWASMDYLTITELQPTPTVTLVHTIQTYSDGSITIDGNPYQ